MEQPSLTLFPLEEADNLRIRFYDSTYNKSFGSIFATVDICALIPDDEADVCILEEPEHMNWMRVVDETPEMSTEQKEIAQLGWAVKFNHVVGIVHTNYDAYVRQYGMGAAFLAGSALQALSAMVTRAYCHKVIRLSDALPSLDKPKEVTCNVHGVRSEFLDPPQACEENKDMALASIYFIGKVVRMLCTTVWNKCVLRNSLTFSFYRSGPRAFTNCSIFKSCTRRIQENIFQSIFTDLVLMNAPFNELFLDGRVFLTLLQKSRL